MKNLMFLVFFLTTSNIAFCQSIRDEFYLEKLDEFTDTNNDSLLFYASKLKKSTNLCYKFVAINKEAKAYYQKGNLALSLKKTYSVLDNTKNKNDDCFKKQQITALIRQFWIFKNQNKFQEAFDVLMKRKNIILDLSNKDQYYEANIISTDHNLAIIKSILGFDKEARELLKKIIPKLPAIYEGLDENDYYLKLNTSSAYNIIGESYLKTSINSTSKELDSASFYFKKAFEVSKEFVPQHENSEKLYKLRETQVLIAKKSFNDALNLLSKYSIENNDFKTVQNIYSLKAISYYNIKQLDSSFYYANLFLKNHKKNPNSKKRLISIYDILANINYKNKVLDSAYKYSELTLNEIKDLNENKNEVNKAYYLYDFKNAQKLNSSILQKEKQNRQVLTIIYIIAGILVFFIISYLIKRNKKITANLEEFKSEIENNSPASKTEYEIDKNLEKVILNGIDELKNSNDFLNSDFTIKAFAKRLNTNTSYLSYFLNKNYNQSFKQLLAEKRIEFLIDKLEKDPNYRKYTIKSLGEEIGYTNDSSFTRAFKKLKGITPSEFIKRLNSNT